MNTGSFTHLPKVLCISVRCRRSRAFTLIELMVSITILVILMLVVTQVIGIVQRSWVRANARVTQFREARVAFDTLTRNLSQATLNTYLESASDPFRTDAAGQQVTRARANLRQSELQFVCGPTTKLLTSSGSKVDYPGHAVFFQAPLGVTRLVAATASQANTENMVNLLCGRGYFVEWGDDQPYRPPFLNQITSVPPRFRLRLMEYSPTAEMNRIYADGYRLIDPDDRTKITNSRKWFQEALTTTVKDGDKAQSRAFTRPIAENILSVVISPQIETTVATATKPYAIAPQYEYDSALITNPGANSSGSPQGTQHLLPPQLKVTMIALDQASGEFLAREENAGMRSQVLAELGDKFTSASEFLSDLKGGGGDKLGGLEAVLVSNKLNYRVFTTTIALRQSRWSL